MVLDVLKQRVALGKRLTALITVFSLFFAALVANLTYIQQVDAERIQSLPSNSHTIARSAYVQRGAIITSDGVTLAESTQQPDGTYTRSYPQGTLARHTVGYISTQYGSDGVEATMDGYYQVPYIGATSMHLPRSGR